MAMSLPLRKCGLKPFLRRKKGGLQGHFPCGSVDWNIQSFLDGSLDSVTSLAEVWIETWSFPGGTWHFVSLPLRKCGLKLWWRPHFPAKCRSLPLRKCGLKHANLYIIYLCRSHFPCGSVDWNSERWRALKHKVCHFPCGSVDWNVRVPRTPSMARPSLPLRKCGLKPVVVVIIAIRAASLPLRKCGLKRICNTTSNSFYNGHFPCGSVDWNIFLFCQNSLTLMSLPLRKCGLKLLKIKKLSFTASSLPLRKCGLKPVHCLYWLPFLSSLPLRKCGLKLKHILVMLSHD